METPSLKAQARTEKGRKTRAHQDSRIPAILYGHGIDNHNLWVDTTSFMRIFTDAGESSIIDMSIDNDKNSVSVIIRDIQRHPLSHEIIHIDFYQIKRGEEMTADVAIHLTGESLAVKNMGGTLMQGVDTIEVKCLPKDLPQEIIVNISSLDNFDDRISVVDLSLSDNVVCLTDDSVVIASVSAPRVEKETKIEEEENSADTEIIEEGTTEEKAQE